VGDFFLDSSVFFSYVGPASLEPYHQRSVDCLELGSNRRFSSTSVKAEVENRRRTRERLYAALLSHVQTGKRIRDFPVEDYSRHDADRARALIRQLRGNDADLEYMRLLIVDLRARMRFAFRRLQEPLVPRSGDVYFEDQLRALADLQRGDSIIASDYLHWAAAMQAPVAFLSGDLELVDGLRKVPPDILLQKFGDSSRNFTFDYLRDYRQ